MKIFPIAAEPTRFHAEGRTLLCTACKRHSKTNAKRVVEVGSHCPRCAEGKMEARLHLVDLAPYDSNGKCSCEHFDFNLRPQIEAMSFAQRQEVRLRCEHILAARDRFLDDQITDYVRRSTAGRTQAEENQ